MAETTYHDLEHCLSKGEGQSTSKAPSVYLLYGEEVLYKKAFEKLLNTLLGERPRDIHCEKLEGFNENVPLALERINTYSLLSSCKIVALTDARLFYSRQNIDRIWDRTARAFQADEMKKAARYFMDLLSVQNLTLEDLGGASPEDLLRPLGGGKETDWIHALLDYCRQYGLKVPASVDPQQELQKAIEQGFPTEHYLIITTPLVDKRRTLYKTIREKGLVVDCSVPLGDRKADRMAQETLLNEAVAEGLEPYGKRMEPAAQRALYDMTGFDLRTLATSLEKLVHFTGERTVIGVDDVRRSLHRTRKDPLYALTEAVSSRQLSQSLFFLQSLLTSGDFEHPLPLLAAIANQMRRLLVAKDFAESPYGRVWQSGCSYPQFQSQVMPAIKAFDEALQKKLTAWNETLAAQPAKPKKGKGAKKKVAVQSDLLMAGKGRSPYPVYKTLQKAEQFSRGELLGSIRMLGDADRRLKRSGSSGRIVLEHVILSICQPEATDSNVV